MTIDIKNAPPKPRKAIVPRHKQDGPLWPATYLVTHAPRFYRMLCNWKTK